MELVLSLVLLSVVSIAIVRVTVKAARFHRLQNATVHSNANLRAALAFLQRELRPLNTTNRLGSDIVRADASAIVYRSMQGLFFVCGFEPPPGHRLVLRPATAVTPAALDAASESILLFLPGHPSAERPAEWVEAEVLGTRAGSACADGSGGVRVTLGGIPHTDWSRIQLGVPVRSFVTSWVRLYADAKAKWWLGGRRWTRPNGWSRTQPIVGPFAPDGVRFLYWDESDALTSSGMDVRRIGIRLIGASANARTVHRRFASTLESVVALRNSTRAGFVEKP